MGNIYSSQWLLLLVMVDEDDVCVFIEEEKIKFEDDSKIVLKFRQNKLEKEV